MKIHHAIQTRQAWIDLGAIYQAAVAKCDGAEEPVKPFIPKHGASWKIVDRKIALIRKKFELKDFVLPSARTGEKHA